MKLSVGIPDYDCYQIGIAASEKARVFTCYRLKMAGLFMTSFVSWKQFVWRKEPCRENDRMQKRGLWLVLNDEGTGLNTSVAMKWRG